MEMNVVRKMHADKRHDVLKGFARTTAEADRVNMGDRMQPW